MHRRRRLIAFLAALLGAPAGAIATAGTAAAQSSDCGGATLNVTVTATGHEHSCRKPRPDGAFVAHGYHIVWGKNGIKLVEGGYLDGQRHGRWTTRGADGRVVDQQEFDRGTPVPLGSVKETASKRSTAARPDPPACPAGHEIAGSTSQLGFEQWCERRDAGGAVVEHGRYLAWGRDGWLREEGEYRDGRQHGRWTLWASLRKSAERHYLDGDLHGTFTKWATLYERPATQEEYRHGVKHGPATWWAGNGAKEWEGEFKDGRRHGRWTRWYENGTKREEVEFAADELDGAATYWDGDGRKRAEGRHVRYQRDGWWTLWDESGRRSDVHYRSGEETKLVPAPVAGCSSGTEAVEFRTKLGLERFCRKPLPDGRWVEHGPYFAWHPTGAKRAEGQFTDGKERGQWTTWHPSGQRASNGHYWNGLRQGPWVTWHDNGRVASEGEYRDGRQQGRWTQFWPHGARMGEGDYVNGKQHGRWIMWSLGTPSMKLAEGEYVDGKREGAWPYYDASGGITRTLQYREGRIDGHRVHRFPSGAKQAEGDLRRDQKDGRWTEWFENGLKEREATYRNGRGHGRMLTWDARGRLVSDQYYLNNLRVTLLAPVAPAAVAFTCPPAAQASGDAPPRGHARWCEISGPSGAVRQGPYTAWHPSSAKKEEGEYRDGKKHGRWTVWTAEGARQSEGEYRDGREHGRWTLWQPGERTEGEFRDGVRQGMWTTWSTSGAKLSEGAYVDGKKQGTWTRWEGNGSKQEETGYLADQKHGPSITSRAGVKESEGVFRNGRPDGRWTTWHRDGRKAGEADFRDGHPVGPFTTWHANGQKSAEGHFRNGGAEGEFTLWDRAGRRRMAVSFANRQVTRSQAWDESGREITDDEQFEQQRAYLDGEPNSLLTLLLLMAGGAR